VRLPFFLIALVRRSRIILCQFSATSGPSRLSTSESRGYSRAEAKGCRENLRAMREPEHSKRNGVFGYV
jgi:hypothetical protein